MKQSILIIISLLFIIGCEEEPIDHFDYSKNIAGSYRCHLVWELENSPEDFVGFSLNANVNRVENYYILKFEPHPEVNLPTLNLNVSETFSKWENTWVYIDAVENSGKNVFQNSGRRDDNCFRVTNTIKKVKLNLSLKSTDLDSVYSISIKAERFY